MVHLGKAIAAAAGEGRADVAGELAAIVGRLAGEGRAEALAARGVAVLGPRADRAKPR